LYIQTPCYTFVTEKNQGIEKYHLNFVGAILT
jgi:hypothetical protein